MTKLFIAPRRQGKSDIHLIGSFYNAPDIGNTIFTSKNPQDFAYKNFEFIDSLADADYILIHHAITGLDTDTEKYLDEVRALSKQSNKKIIVFIGGDMSHDVFIDDMIVFKGSQYKYMMRDNEIIVPPFAEDLLDGMDIIIRDKGEKPVVSFCGWADFPSTTQKIKYYIKNFLVILKKIITLNTRYEVHKKGIYFRRKAMNILRKSKLVKTNFIVRTSFSANKKTISLDPMQARKEYIENIINSDFVLTPKGDANFSVRFYEVLGLGRIPILIDTETVLPLENHIDYSTCAIKVQYKDIKRLPEIIAGFYATLHDEEFVKMQHEARNIFQKLLRYDAFFNYVFSGPIERLLPQ